MVHSALPHGHALGFRVEAGARVRHSLAGCGNTTRDVSVESRGKSAGMLGEPRPALWLMDGFRKGMFKQSDAGCLAEEKDSECPPSPVSSFTDKLRLLFSPSSHH